MKTKFKCAECGKQKEVHFGPGTGYGLDREGNKVCYDCCAVRDKREMDEKGKITLYLVKSERGKYEVTNWPETLRFPVHRYSIGRHNIAGRRYDVWFRDHKGKMWHGVTYGDNTEICHCRRVKE